MSISVQDLVNREVHYCVSALVSTLAQNDLSDCNSTRDLAVLNQQAIELASPIDDWEEAALQAGWRIQPTRTARLCCVTTISSVTGH